MSSKAVQFIGLSGGGWCFDFAIFYVEVVWLGLQVIPASFVSATIAAMGVFFVSQRFIFHAQRISIRAHIYYFAYTELNIFLWALIIGYASTIIHNLSTFTDHNSALAAKVFVTPCSLLCNFLVSKWASKIKKP